MVGHSYEESMSCQSPENMKGNTSMKKSSVPILTVFILLMLVPPSEGQSGITRIFGRSLNITGYMTLGANWIDVQSLNTALEEYDYLLLKRLR